MSAKLMDIDVDLDWDEEVPEVAPRRTRTDDTLRIELFRSLRTLSAEVPEAVGKLQAASDAAVKESRLVRFEARKTKRCSQSQREIPAAEAVPSQSAEIQIKPYRKP